MRIEDRCVYERGKALGFRLFQGHYFQQPETVCTRTLSSSQFSRLKLLQAIEQADPDLRSLAETIRTDVALSYKLFGLLNSAHFSLPSPVRSVQQALALIGWEPLRTWIRLIILTDLTPAGKTSELPRSATLRGRFLELSAQGRAAPGPEALFLVGLFSLLPAMLDQPMEQILEFLRLPAEVNAALLSREGGCAVWLTLAVAFEHADWAGVQAAITALGLEPLVVATAYAQAVEWTDTLFRSVPA
jgi:EAL and modified HD-GYP domain-containing signal transduction protein